MSRCRTSHSAQHPSTSLGPLHKNVCQNVFRDGMACDGRDARSPNRPEGCQSNRAQQNCAHAECPVVCLRLARSASKNKPQRQPVPGMPADAQGFKRSVQPPLGSFASTNSFRHWASLAAVAHTPTPSRYAVWWWCRKLELEFWNCGLCMMHATHRHFGCVWICACLLGFPDLF
jgi:hypothetical protein